MKETGNKELLNIPQSEVVLKNTKALFYNMVTTADHTDKVYTRDVVVGVDDVLLLNDRVLEKLRQYKDAGFAVSISIKYESKKEIKLSRWEDFNSYTRYEDSPINSIVLKWDFNAVFEGYEFPQKHTLMVKISNGMRPEEMLNIIFSGGIENFNEFDNNFVPIVARVDFIDRLMGDELLTIVTNWVSGLRDSSIDRWNFLTTCKKHKRKLALLVDYGTYFFGSFMCVFAIHQFINPFLNQKVSEVGMSEVSTLINLFLGFFFWVFAGRKITSGIGKSIFNTLKEYGISYVFDITRGDKQRKEKMQKQEKYDKIKMFTGISLTVIVNLSFILVDHLMFK